MEPTRASSASAKTALGKARVKSLETLTARLRNLQAQTAEVGTTDVLLRSLEGAAIQTWRERARQRGEEWVYVASPDGTTLHALDEPSELAEEDPAAAVVYPEVHSRLVAWWLIHAWRGADLLEDTIENLLKWRITSGAVTARALVEEAGSLVDEALKLSHAWKVGKATPAHVLTRPASIRGLLAPILVQASFGSRMKISHETLKATNVLTLVQKLSKVTGDARFEEWYDWLSDAAHPALGARIAFASPPMVHDSGAVTARCYARAPLLLTSDGETSQMEPTIALIIADAMLASGEVIADVLDQSLAVVDDVGLTTAAATLTRRTYWRNLIPVRGNRACPCGRGRWRDCRHWWKETAPSIEVPRTSPRAP
ncbi:hypothetical protein [Actinopolymorpha sp. B9G3]|uniref:hypothetical protein n=1 Tax=Actinopolymorpha sp. B9G3 TaxID=3158970 RepID=UPI0032D9A2CB